MSGKSDREVLRKLEQLTEGQKRTRLLRAAHVAELEERELFREAGYDSIEAYCEAELGLTKQELLAAAGDRNPRQRG